MKSLGVFLKLVPFFLLCFVIFFLQGCSHTPTSTASLGADQTPKERGDLFLELGTHQLSQGDFSRALTNLKNAVELNPKSPVIWNHLGLTYLGLADLSAAERSFQEALRLDKAYSDVWVNLAALQIRKGNSSEALVDYGEALKNLEYTHKYKAHVGQAQIFLAQGQNDQARLALMAALQDNPKYCLAHLLMGHLQKQVGHAALALKEYKKSIEGTCTTNMEGHLGVGDSYVKLKDFSKARSVLMDIIEKSQDPNMISRAEDMLRNMPF